MKRWLIYFLILLASIAVLIIFFIKIGTKPETIRIAGIVEGIEVNISTKVPGRILEIYCKEGDAVREGNTIFKLEANDLVASVKQALAGVKKAKAEVHVSETAIESSKANIASAEAEVKSTEAEVEANLVQMEEAKRQMDRAIVLYKQETVSKESHDIAVTNYGTIFANYTSSKARLTAAHSRNMAAHAQLKMAESQLEYARSGLRESKANLLYHRTRLADATIKSPISGVVVFKASEKGEMITPGTTILTIVDLNNLYVRMDIEETLVGSVIIGSETTIRTEGIPGRIFKGRVSEIGRYAEFATQRDVLRGRQDIKTFRVKIAVDDPTGFLKPGMTAEVEMPKRMSYGSTEKSH